MSQALRPGTETPDMPCRAKWLIGDLTTMERLNTVARGIAEGNHLSGATLVRHGGAFPPHRNAALFQPRGQRIEGRSVRDLPAEKTLPIRQPAVDDEALFAVIHAEGTHGAAAINRLQPKLATSKPGPVIELRSANPEIAHCLNGHGRDPPFVLAGLAPNLRLCRLPHRVRERSCASRQN